MVTTRTEVETRSDWLKVKSQRQAEGRGLDGKRTLAAEVKRQEMRKAHVDHRANEDEQIVDRERSPDGA